MFDGTASRPWPTSLFRHRSSNKNLHFSLMSLCLVLLTFDPFRDNERLRQNMSHAKRPTAKLNLEENGATPAVVLRRHNATRCQARFPVELRFRNWKSGGWQKCLV